MTPDRCPDRSDGNAQAAHFTPTSGNPAHGARRASASTKGKLMKTLPPASPRSRTRRVFPSVDFRATSGRDSVGVFTMTPSPQMRPPIVNLPRRHQPRRNSELAVFPCEVGPISERLGALVGQSSATQEIFATIHQLAPTCASALITGPEWIGKGTGCSGNSHLQPPKARSIHCDQRRRHSGKLDRE